MKVLKIQLYGKGEALYLTCENPLDIIDFMDLDDFESEYTIRIVSMSEEEFKNLPEFGGF